MTTLFLRRSALAGALAWSIPLLTTSAEREQQPWASTASLETPALFAPGEISTGDFESHPSFTPDGTSLFFVKSNAAFTAWTIVVSRFEGGHWLTPTVPPFSGQYNDADPFVTIDGQRLYFISDRPRVPGDERTTSGTWIAPRPGGVPRSRWAVL